MLTRRCFLATQAGALSLLTGTAKSWAATYPNGPITFLEPFPVGGSIDVVMRAIAPKLQHSFSVPVIVESRTGAAGVIATAAVAKAPPNGQTLLAAASSLAANQTLAKNLPFDTSRDLQAVSLVFRTPLILVVTPSLPVYSVSDLISLLKKEPGRINYAHSGVGAAIHLASELFQEKTQTRMTGIAYRGVPPAITDLAQGRVQVMFADAGAMIAQVKARTVRALGVSSTERLKVLPDIPTISEAGVPGFDAVGWTLVCSPARTPREIVDLLSKELSMAASSSDVKNLIERLGCIPVQSPSPDELQKFLVAEIGRWGRIIEAAGLAKSQ